jgi:hypothetical protein
VIEVGIDGAEDITTWPCWTKRAAAGQPADPRGVEGLARLHAVLADQVEGPAQVLVGSRPTVACWSVRW